MGRWLVVAGLLAMVLSPAAFAASCNQVNVVTDTAGGTLSDLSDQAARICAVEFLANAANGWAAVWDTPDDTPTHGQAQPKAHLGAAAAYNSDQREYGESGRLTRFGLDVEVVRGTLIIQWSGAAP